MFEAETPALRSLPLAVQQKYIIVTCNYEARRRGLRKLQLVSEAKKICPDLVIVLGEDLGKFRDVSKALFCHLKTFTWNKKVERLGFDEVFMDVTDIVTYNQALLNKNDLSQAFFHLSREDPMAGFSFDATKVAGHLYPEILTPQSLQPINTMDYYDLAIRLVLGSHLAQHIRLNLQEDKGYTSSAGISTSKLLAKLVGNLHKPKDQTTLMPPYEAVLAIRDGDPYLESNVTTFIDSYEIGKIPGIGFKMSRKIRDYFLSNSSSPGGESTHNEVQELVKVRDIRLHPGMGPDTLEVLLGGPGAETGIGTKVWHLINGVDESNVRETSMIPSQISIENSYVRLDTISQVRQELQSLATSLLKRMYIDLLSDINDEDGGGVNKRWVACPKTIRLSARPRLVDIEDSRIHAFNRTSRSRPLPNFIFNLRESVDVLVSRLVQETLIPMFHLLPAKQNWNLSLINIAVTNMAEMASNDGNGKGRDIGFMFKRQHELFKEQRTVAKNVPSKALHNEALEDHSWAADEVRVDSGVYDGNTKEFPGYVADHQEATWGPGDNAMWGENENRVPDRCCLCGAIMPPFAMAAHERYHALGDE